MTSYRFYTYDPVLRDQIVQVDPLIAQLFRDNELIQVVILQLFKFIAKHFTEAFVDLLDLTSFVQHDGRHRDAVEQLCKQRLVLSHHRLRALLFSDVSEDDLNCVSRPEDERKRHLLYVNFSPVKANELSLNSV